MKILNALIAFLSLLELCGCAGQAQPIKPQPTHLAGYWVSSSSLHEEQWFIRPDGVGKSCSVSLVGGEGPIPSGKLSVAGNKIVSGGALYEIMQASPDSFDAKQSNGPSHFSFRREVEATGACTNILPKMHYLSEV